MEIYRKVKLYRGHPPPCVLQTLAEILSEREMIGHLMENILDEATRPWGVKVERVEIKVSK